MKLKLLPVIAAFMVLMTFSCGEEFDDTFLLSQLDSLQNRIDSLENQLDAANEELSTLDALRAALDSVTESAGIFGPISASIAGNWDDEDSTSFNIDKDYNILLGGRDVTAYIREINTEEPGAELYEVSVILAGSQVFAPEPYFDFETNAAGFNLIFDRSIGTSVAAVQTVEAFIGARVADETGNQNTFQLDYFVGGENCIECRTSVLSDEKLEVTSFSFDFDTMMLELAFTIDDDGDNTNVDNRSNNSTGNPATVEMAFEGELVWGSSFFLGR